LRWEGSTRRIARAAGERAAAVLDWTAIGEAMGTVPIDSDASVAIGATSATRESKANLDFE
jgi:hypothetical protein